MINITSLESISLTDLVNVFNESFADYVVPLQLTESLLAAKLQSENIHPAYSAGVFEHGRPVGFILTGIDTINNVAVAYNAGTGVIPSHRGNGLTARMYDFLLPQFQKKGLQQCLLEVIQTNPRAVAVYQKKGFTITRRLVCFKGRVKAMPLPDIITIADGQLEEIDDRFWDSRPSYQHTIAAIQRDAASHRLAKAIVNDTMAGYIVYATTTGRIKQSAIAPSYRRQGIGRALFTHVQSILPDKELAVINVDATDTGSLAFLQAIGLPVMVEQYEMERPV